MSWLSSIDSSLTSHALVFVGGLASGLSPCTLPTIALVVAYVGGYGKGWGRALGLSLSFVAGLSFTLAALGFVVAAAGGLFRDYRVMTYLAAFLCLLMGCNLLGWLPVPTPGARLRAGGPNRRAGLLASFLLGVPFAFAASPCTTPVTIAVLAYAASSAAPVYGATLLFCYALGRSIPLLVAGVLAGSAAAFTVSDMWSARLKRASGLVLLAVGLYLVWRVR